MAIDIKVSGGVDFNAYLADFAANFEAAGRGAFSNGLSGDEYALWSGDAATLPVEDAQAFVVESGAAGDLAYDFMTHTVSGAIDAIDFGSGVTDTGGGDYETDSEVLLSGLGLESAGAGGIVNQLMIDLMSGKTDVLMSLLQNADLNFSGSSSKDAFSGFKGDDTINGGAGSDKLLGNGGTDVISGGKGHDVIDGGNGADILNGGQGDDSIKGGGGNDTINGGQGDDVLRGDGGNDTFVFSGNFGDDVIKDFAAGPGVGDVISFVGTPFENFGDVLGAASENASGDVVITVGEDRTVTLKGVEIADLSANDFLFS